MNKFAQLAADITKLWTKYGTAYLSGIENTLILALVGTVIGCLIGFVCGILNTIPRRPNDHPLKKAVLALVQSLVMSAASCANLFMRLLLTVCSVIKRAGVQLPPVCVLGWFFLPRGSILAQGRVCRSAHRTFPEP